jgi:uncharacterized membrane-anchored protein
MDDQSTPTPIAFETTTKVPNGSATFWVTKVLTTAMGEILSDYLVHRLGNVPAVALGALGLAAAMLVQFSVPNYVPWIYWTAVAMVAVFGTMAADVLHIQFGVPYLVSTVFFAAAIAAIFTLWYVAERTLSIHSVYTRQREVFYWATVMATFALGTAAGDMTAKTMNLGYFASGVGFVVLIAIPALAYWRLGLNSVVAFWSAYVLTRPVGASFADWVGKPHNLSGLGIGDPPVIVGLTVMIIGLVVHMTMTQRHPPVPTA